MLPRRFDRTFRKLPTRPEAQLLSTPPFRALMNSKLFSYSPVQFYYPGTIAEPHLKWWLYNSFEPAPLGVFRQFAESTKRGGFTSVDGRLDYESIWRDQRDPIPVLSICPDRDSFIAVEDAQPCAPLEAV